MKIYLKKNKGMLNGLVFARQLLFRFSFLEIGWGFYSEKEDRNLKFFYF